jgi:hypothetical protein
METFFLNAFRKVNLAGQMKMVYNRPQEEEKMFRESFKNTCIEQKKLQDGQMKRMLMPHSVFDLARSS